MIYCSPLRRLILPILVLVGIVVFYRSCSLKKTFPDFILHQPPDNPAGIRIPASHLQQPLTFKTTDSGNYLQPPNEHYYYYYTGENHFSNKTNYKGLQPAHNPNLTPLFQCPVKANSYTGHLRLNSIVQNISQIPPHSLKEETRVFWNPTVIALPHWSKNQYLVVSRIVTDGNHQENVLCEANVCHVSGQESRLGEKVCTDDDLDHVGPGGGMRCATPPTTLSVPPTPAEKCEGKFMEYADIPGFHDPRMFWSGKGEPLMMVNTQSRYACFGLWLIDLRSLYPSLDSLLASSPTLPSLGPLKSYPTLTELTRNPANTRSQIEKNWFLFFPVNGESYIHYDLSPPGGGPRGRTFAKLLGNGLTTTNLTDSLEQPCLRKIMETEEAGPVKQGGSWHQATNALRLILCNRSDHKCQARNENTVFFAVIHRKFPNWLKLPLRYERFFMVWQATAPFNMLGVSKHPILMANETASGWSASENWSDNSTNQGLVAATKERNLNATEPFGGKDFWAYFTYTVSMSWAWGRAPREGSVGDEAHDMHVGYLDDEVLLAIGVDDKGQAFSRVKAAELVQCMSACPGKDQDISNHLV
ncbi:hypothetical protein ACLMJK_000941 [Lecanora helva]